ncbi:uncharacterized protein CC84DRAFT_1098035 [Paraphaeosphaeria sporulosa]|uniref:Rhodopsin domain-containing protein n=1 Tax=Paraphaeosphaeria sporulosa TaxID=1460663 RepID=A0A177C7Q9_9PLEO|nr:uncharacterized protein CC84DRAFT_1098035 [Paraphaeosphaeria sporulosa]OAG02808.1 hypothetical protein CC84DRAFT_1098035 [Paraphaeosphaeria sporulosa]
MWSETLDPNGRYMEPDGFPLTVLAISFVFLALSVLAVGLRSYIRLSRHMFGIDDAFLAAGAVLYMVVIGLSSYGHFVGLGRKEVDLNQWQWENAMKYYIIWILVYVVALGFIKSSVCLTILRIATTKKPLRMCVWVLLGITWCSFCITFIGTLLYCQPVRAVWTPMLILSGEGYCASTETFIIIAHTATVSTILTDLALVVVPGVLLWETQMKRQAKFQAWALLSFASVASIITMLRIPYINRFREQQDLQFWVSHIVLCSNVETGIGCIASSIPSLRHFTQRSQGSNTHEYSDKRSGPIGFFSVGNGPTTLRKNEGSKDLGISLSTVRGRSDEQWQRITDGDSDHSTKPMNANQIYAVHTYTVEHDDKLSQRALRD